MVGVKYIIAAVGAVVGVAYYTFTAASVTRSAKEKKDELLKQEIASRTEEETDIFKKLDDATEVLKKRNDRERKELSRKVAEYTNATGYEAKKKNYKEVVKVGVKSFKESLDYDGMKEQLLNEAEETHQTYILENGFEAKLEELNNKKKAAEENYQSQKRFLKTMASTTSNEQVEDSIKKIKSTAKKERNAVFESADKEINDIQTKISNHKNLWDSKTKAAIGKLDAQVETEKNRLVNEANAKISELNLDLNKKTDEFKAEIIKDRDEVETTIINEIEELETKAASIQKKEKLNVVKAMEETSTLELLARYFKTRGWKKWQVTAMGILPIIPIVTLTGYYIGYLYKVVKFM